MGQMMRAATRNSSTKPNADRCAVRPKWFLCLCGRRIAHDRLTCRLDDSDRRRLCEEAGHASLRRDHERCPTLSILEADVCTVLEKVLDHALVPRRNGQHQRSSALRTPLVDVGAFGESFVDLLHIPPRDGHAKRSATVWWCHQAHGYDEHQDDRHDHAHYAKHIGGNVGGTMSLKPRVLSWART
jgi:hypothetical protein